MKRSTSLPRNAQIRRDLRKLCRRIVAMTLVAACVFVAPAIASVNRASLNKVRVPRIDSRAMETLQRWIQDEEGSRAEQV